MESNKSNNYFNKIMQTLKESKSFKVICVTILLLLLSIFIFNIVNKSGIIKNVSYIVSAEKVDVTINSNNSADYVETYQVCFTAESSNFEVIIPFKSNYDYQTKIKNIKVEGYKTHIIRNDEYISINIDVKANENELTREGFNRTIVLSYTYDRGYDNDKELDHLDYYIGSPLRPFKLSSFEFNINLPRNTKSSIDNIYSLFTRENTIGTITEVTKLDSRITLSNDGTTRCNLCS